MRSDKLTNRRLSCRVIFAGARLRKLTHYADDHEGVGARFIAPPGMGGYARGRDNGDEQLHLAMERRGRFIAPTADLSASNAR